MRDTKQAIEEIKQSLNSSVENSVEKLGDISNANRYSSVYEVQGIDDYYRHINNGSYNRYNYFRQTNLDSVLAGHKYLIDITVRSSPEPVRVGFGNSANNSVAVSQSSEFSHVRRIIELVQDYTIFGAYMTMPEGGTNGHYVDVKKDAGFYDLTAIFGEGSEPTQSEFDEMVNLYPNADTKTLLFKLLNEGNSILRDELKKFKLLLKSIKTVTR